MNSKLYHQNFQVARLTDIDPRFRSLAPILHHTTLLGDDSHQVRMQTDQSLCVPNAFRNENIPGPSRPDTSQPIDEFRCSVGLPNEPSCIMETLPNETVENREMPSSTTFQMNGSPDRTLVSVGDSYMNKTQDDILRFIFLFL